MSNPTKIIKSFAGIAVLSTLIGTGFMWGLRTTNTTEVGVKVNKWGLNKGVQTEIIQPGTTTWMTPIITEFYTLDTKLVNLAMTMETRDPLKFKTEDGNDINLNINFAYRIDPKKAHLIVQHVAQSEEEIREKIFRTISRSDPRDIFGELTTTEFYNTEMRISAADRVKTQLQNILSPYHIIIERVDPGNIKFENDRYQKAIDDKVNFQQKALATEQEILAQKEKNNVRYNEADKEYNTRKVTADQQYEEEKRSADGYFLEQSQIAEAIKVEADNLAKQIRAQREAMNSEGGLTRIMMQIAESIKDKPIIMVPMGDGGNALNLQTFDVNNFMEMYGTKALGEKYQSVPQPAPQQ